uniref:Endonuclease/exonuclease/phosphatase domain-containing protein n=1 Tax=Seriola lalandi dorsalis TaxID=1841481 RepID=A0A3B4X1X6_SERLL
MEHEKLAKLFDAQVFYSSHHSSIRGVITLIRNHIPYEVEDVVYDKEGRHVLVEGKTDGDDITLLNIYNRPEEGPSTIEKIINLVTVQSKGVIVLGGDFNLLMNEKLILKAAQSGAKYQVWWLESSYKKERGGIKLWRYTTNGSTFLQIQKIICGESRQ